MFMIKSSNLPKLFGMQGAHRGFLGVGDGRLADKQDDASNGN